MDEIEYGVFWKTVYCDKWDKFGTWTASYGVVRDLYEFALSEKLCTAAKIVKKVTNTVTTYEDVEVKEKDDDKS